MKECWRLDAEKRPTFSELVNNLSAYLESLASYLKLVDEDNNHQYDVEVNLEEQNDPVVTLAVNETIM